MPPELACADFSFPLLDHDRVLDLIALLDIRWVDIGMFEGRGHLWPSRVYPQLEKNAALLRKKLADRGLGLADLFLQTAPDFVPFAANHPEAKRRRKAREMFSQTLDFAAACGCGHVSCLPGARFPDEPASRSLGRSADEMQWRLEQATARKLVFSIEAHIGSIVPRPKLALELLRRVPGLTLSLDYTHFTRFGIPDSEVEPLLRYASNFHCRGARKGRLQTTFDQNTIDYGRIVRLMKKIGYHGRICLEYVWTVWERCNEVDNLSETIRFRDFLRGLV